MYAQAVRMRTFRRHSAKQTRLSEELGISLRTVKRNMTALQESGTIVRIGSNKAGYWKVNSES